MTPATEPAPARGLRAQTVARLLQVTGAGLLAFWLLFYTVGLAPRDTPPGYFIFEHSFTLPDTILAIACMVAGYRLSSGVAAHRRNGRTLGLACGGALVFLGVLDVSFNAQNGIYSGWWVDAVMSAVINAWCIGGGLAVVKALGSQQE